MVVPFQDDDTQFYVFTTEEVHGDNTYFLKYSVVDLKEDDGRGDVVIKDVVLFTRSTERLVAFEGGDGFWVMAHEYGSNTFRAYAATSDGLSSPVLSSAGSVHSINDEFSGQTSMKFSGQGDRVAVALIEGNDDFVELFEFDPTTGEIIEFQYSIDLNLGGPAVNDQVYDVHFSPGGNKLFASMNTRNGGSPSGRILEYRVDTFSTEDTRQASRADIAEGSGLNANIGAMQTGPDGQIYVAVEVPGSPAASAFVGSIAVNEDTAANSAFNPQTVNLVVGNSRLGLPNFVQNNVNPPQQPSMSAPDSTCVEETVALSAVGTSDIDQYFWTIVEEGTNTQVFSAGVQDTSFVFSQGQGGRYNISVNIFNRCGFDTTFVQQIDVLNIPDPPALPAFVTICQGETNELVAGPSDAGLTYEWRNSQGVVVSTEATFTVVSEDIYTVTITNALGCSSSGEVFAGPPFEIELPPAQTICQNDELILDPNVTADNYIWTSTDQSNFSSTLPNQQRATVDSSTPGIFTYVVSIEDPISPGCFVNDTTVVTINAQPAGLVGLATDATCNAMDGTFAFDISTTGNYTYEVADNSGIIVETVSNFTGPGTASVTGLNAGLYSVTITDNSSLCQNTLTDIQINNNPVDFAITGTAEMGADCENPTGSVTVSLDSDVFPITYTLTADDGTVLNGGAASFNAGTTFDFDINNLTAGTYNLEVTSSTGCTQSQPNIVISAPTDIVLTTEAFVDICGADAPLVATTAPAANVTITWTGPNGFSATGGNATTTESGIYTVTATSSDPNFCPVSQQVEVNLAIQPIVQITTNDDVCDGDLTLIAEVTNAQPGVTYVYSWANSSSADVLGTSSSLTVTSDETYTVTVREAGNLTCTGTQDETVTFPEPIVATLTSSPACQDGQPITLTVDVTSGAPNSFTWSLNGTNIPGNSNVINVNDEGTYNVVISDGICAVERSIQIRRSAIPDGLLPDTDFYCSTSDANPILTAGVGFVTYEWTLDGQPFPDADQVLTVNAPGTYIVTMTTAQGCVQIDTVEIIESCDPQVLAPNIIVPSSNPPNNTFQVVPNTFVDNFEIFIYNRWGELIFQSNNLTFQWDGTVNGTQVPLGTYPYIMRFTSRFEPGRGTFEQQGSVTVVR